MIKNNGLNVFNVFPLLTISLSQFLKLEYAVFDETVTILLAPKAKGHGDFSGYVL